MLNLLRQFPMQASGRKALVGHGICVGATVGSSLKDPRIAEISLSCERLVGPIVAGLARLSGLPLGFKFSSLQINTGTCDWHRDSNNYGLSCIVTFGSYDGGRFLREGYEPADIFGKPLVFNGSVQHATEWFQGERWVIVAFTHETVFDMSENQLTVLRRLNFPLPIHVLKSD